MWPNWSERPVDLIFAVYQTIFLKRELLIGAEMSKISKILCVVDPTTKAQPAVSRAEWLAKGTGAQIELMTCYYNEFLSGEPYFDSPGLENVQAELLDGHKKYLEEIAEPLRSAGLSVATAAIWDHPLYEGIVRHAVRCNANVVLKDTHHHAAISRALFSNTDWNLIRTCPVPLWLVKPHDLDDKPNFIAAVDPLNQHEKPAALDDEILTLSKSIAKDVGGEVHVFHSFDPRMAIATTTADAYAPVSLLYDEIEQQMREHHQRRFKEITQFYEISDEHAHIVAGLTHEELTKLAKKLNAAVVVMGAVARNRLKRLFIGATAERTLEHIPCDVLIVKPAWFRSPVDMEIEDAA